LKKTGFWILLAMLSLSCEKDPEVGYEALPNLNERVLAGGETTVFLTSSNAFSTPAANLSGSDLNKHLDGDLQFESVFVSAPSEINGGVGPIFNNSSCVACHPKDGRSAFPSNINQISGFFLRTSLPGQAEMGGPRPVPNFGKQLQNQAIFGYEAEVQFAVSYIQRPEIFGDGTKVMLQKPVYGIAESYIPFPEGALLSPRLAPPVFGLGLLEAIPAFYILSNEDVNDSDGDGISGKANYVHDPISNTVALGRFGWKANTATILEQCAGAYLEDMGITSPIFPTETGMGQSNGNDGMGDDPEIALEVVDEVAFYCKTLGVPAARNLNEAAVQRGSQLFESIQCAKCHIPKMITEYNPIQVLSNQVFYPYTDMLLHDMGEDMADNRPDFLANGREWKTRPLWGIGLTQIVNGHTHFLHDGRAKNITEAILWHGGEATTSKEAFKNLTAEERSDLLAFINAL